MMINKILKILYIEDNQSNRNLVKYILDSDQFEYYESEDALSGINLASQVIPDIILMDINMDGMSGIEATIRIKQIPEICNIPIIAITAKTLQDDREKILAAGCSAYIPKPIDVSSFSKRILEVYDGAKESLNEQENIKFLKQNQDEIVSHLEQEVLKLRESEITLSQKVIELENKNIELKKAQEMLIHSEKLSTAGQLVAGIIHEIRTPLTGIMGYNQLLEIHLKDEKLQSYVQHCIKAVDKIKNIISDMLNFSKKHDTSVTEVTIGEVFKNIKSLIQILSKQEKIKIAIDLLFSDIKVKGNLSQIEQIVMILVNNAVHAVKQNNKQESKMPPIRISAVLAKDSDEVILIVEDDGIGIELEVQDKIFDAFYTTKSVDEGTGLGLNICKTIVSSIGGRIEFRSEVKKGSVFRIFFPRILTD